jgi:pimeloyl-ACP methyl ester carboxylesterase
MEWISHISKSELCLHGFPDTAWSFAPVLKSLADAGYRAVAPPLRGYPPSGLAQSGDYRVIILGRRCLRRGARQSDQVARRSRQRRRTSADEGIREHGQPG